MTPPPFGYRDKFLQARTEALEAAGVETPEDHLEPETPEDHLAPEFTTGATGAATQTSADPGAALSTAPAGVEDLEGTSPALEVAGHDDAPSDGPSSVDVAAAGSDSTGEEGPA